MELKPCPELGSTAELPVYEDGGSGNRGCYAGALLGLVASPRPTQIVSLEQWTNAFVIAYRY